MLGLGDSRPEVCKPTVIPSLKKYCIEQISSCFEHNIALARTGEVFTWGVSVFEICFMDKRLDHMVNLVMEISKINHFQRL